MSGYDDFLRVLSNYRSLSITAVGSGAAVPFVAYLAHLAPPWPPGIMLATAVGELVSIILAFQLTYQASRRKVTRAMILLSIVWLCFSAMYVTLFGTFTYTTKPTEERMIAGFICLPDISQIKSYKSNCPLLSDEELSNGKYDPENFWEPWTIIFTKLALCSAWMAAFIALSGLVGAFISFQSRVPSRNAPAS